MFRDHMVNRWSASSRLYKVLMQPGEVAAQDRAAAEVTLLAARAPQVIARRLEVPLGDRRLGHLAIIVRDRDGLLRHADRAQGTQQLRRLVTAHGLEALCRGLFNVTEFVVID